MAIQHAAVHANSLYTMSVEITSTTTVIRDFLNGAWS